MTILVTGGAGFIGANFIIEWFSSFDEQVVTVDKLTYAGNIANLDAIHSHPKHHFIQGDIGDRDQIAGLLTEYRPRAIVNFAAESHVDRSISGPSAFIQTNIVGTFNLLDNVRLYHEQMSAHEASAFRFLHISTDEVFGSLGPNDPAFMETTAYAPNSPYSASKAASDHLVRAYHHTYGLPVLTTNCTNNYGPFQYPEKLIPVIVGKALRGEAIPIYGDGLNIRDWLHVSDHCAAIRVVLDKGIAGETYNVSAGNEITNIDLTKTICSLLDEMAPDKHLPSREALITYVPDRLGHDRRYAMDASKLRSTLNWKPERSFEIGLRDTVKWYLDNHDWVRGTLERSRVDAAQ